MREMEFRRFLSESDDIVSKEKAVASRVSKALAVEKKLNVNLDTIVKSEDETYRLLLLIRKQMNEVNGVYQNAVRKYYLFVNGKEFPKINQYEKKSS